MDEERTVVEQLERVVEATTDLHTDFADGVRHDVTEALDAIKESIQDDLRNCGHCGSPFTFRRSDGDIGCYDCRGIMPVDELYDLIGSQCPECDGYLVFHPPEFEEENQGEMTEDIKCGNCRTEFVQRWELKEAKRTKPPEERPGS